MVLEPRHTCVPGRARIHVGGLRGARGFAAQLQAGLNAHPSIRQVRASHLTGNVTVAFDKAFGLDGVLSLLRALHGAQTARPRAAYDHWHARAKTRVVAALGTHAIRGLPTAVARRRLRIAGANTVNTSAGRSPLAILAGQFQSLPVAVLAAGAVLSLFTGVVLEAVAISAVLAINGVIGFVTESHAEATIHSLESHGPTQARVMRDGSAREVPASVIVPGDILLLNRGTLIAADARVITDQGLSVTQAMLTGESVPVAKRADAAHGRNTPLAERRNMVYRGTIVTSGSGTAVVVATGADTEAGRVQRLVAASPPPETPTYRQLTALGMRLAWITAAASLTLFLFGRLRGLGVMQMLRSAVSLAVASVPEGLPMVATTTHAIGVNALRGRNVLVRRLDAVETLASVNVVCFDKTGTLTQNRMSVAEILTPASRLSIEQGAERATMPDASASPLRKLLEVACLCSEVALARRNGACTLEGSATEVALVRCAQQHGVDFEKLRRDKPRLTLQERTETYRFMVTTHSEAGRVLVAMKGNPAEILARCQWEARPSDGRRLLTPARTARIEQHNLAMARRGLRVLGFAYALVDSAAPSGAREAAMVWLGAAALQDPIRPGVPHLMRRLHRAGVRTIMLTGDQYQTARAVAHKIGLAGTGRLRILDATQIAALSAGELGHAARRAHVFARVTPAQKLTIVRALQATGAVIAVVGDGINDSPALRAAHVGLAMGINGDAAAREVSDIFLHTEDIGLLAQAIGQGRTTRANIRKALRFILSTNTSEVLLMLAAVVLGLGEGLTPMQLLWINVITDVFPGIGLALERADPGVLDRRPFSPQQPILGDKEISGLVAEGATVASGALLAGIWAAARFGAGSRQMRSMIFGALVFAQLQHAIACRAPRGSLRAFPQLRPNPQLTTILAASFALQGAAFLIAPLRRGLGLASVGPAGGIVMALASLLPSLLRLARSPAERRSALRR
jgi:Ca2+-transporting ATPase